MPKKKTHKGMAKRMKITARGKVKRTRAGRGHLRSHKSGKKIRELRNDEVLSKADEKFAKQMLSS